MPHPNNNKTREVADIDLRLFPLDNTKQNFYSSLDKQLNALLEGETDVVANLANTSALLYDQLDELNWLGFYLLKEGELVLGPFQGKTACVRIALGKGVCGTAAVTEKTQVVADVHQFEGHIACDIRSKSEIVIPVFKNDKVFGVLDIDSPILNRFDNNDASGLEAIVRTLESHIN